MHDSKKVVELRLYHLSDVPKRPKVTVDVRDGVCTPCFVFQQNSDALFQGRAYAQGKGLHWFYFEYVVNIVCEKNK